MRRRFSYANVTATLALVLVVVLTAAAVPAAGAARVDPMNALRRE